MAKSLTLISDWKTFVCGFLKPVRNSYNTCTKLNGRSTSITYVTDTTKNIVSFCVQVYMPLIMPFNFMTKSTAKNSFFIFFWFPITPTICISLDNDNN